MPITKERWQEWCDVKDNLIKMCGYYLNEYDKNTLNEITSFVYIYHVVGV